jgi:hypothetical protein
MKRDRDLIRSLLLEIELKDDGTGNPVNIDKRVNTDRDITEHLFLLANAGLIEAIDASSMDARDIIVLRLTWEGHEYLDNIRDPEIWAGAKSGAQGLGGFSLEILGALAKGLIKKKIEQHTGVEINV